ncbi:putative F-box/LRR-repeat protein At5g41840 isoform X2 [Tripterygium wilfordii]|nr:putative F-box/LRR-repeat protein At5g41840 isoform X2 [Tripterygium wilfordii]
MDVGPPLGLPGSPIPREVEEIEEYINEEVEINIIEEVGENLIEVPVTPPPRKKRTTIARPKFTDRINELLMHIVHHIISFLPTEDFLKLSLSSKRFRDLCISSPSLSFDGMSVGVLPSIYLLNYLDRIMSLHKNTETYSLRVYWGIQSFEEKYRICSWLHKAISCNVKVLDLKFWVEDFAIPVDVFCSKSLRSLKLNFSGGKLKLPSNSGISTKLQSLLLKHFVPENKQHFEEWISLACKSLNSLDLVYFAGVDNIRINSSSLKQLNIYTACNVDLCFLEVSAAMLKDMDLYWTFGHTNNISFADY